MQKKSKSFFQCRKIESTWRRGRIGERSLEGFAAVSTMPGSSSNLSVSSKSRSLAELLSAIGEESLMLFLFINAWLAYLATSFARLCKLPEPCLQCSRLGHMIGSDGQGLFRSTNLLCGAHRAEMSSLLYCDDHRKLADFRDMCEACLVSSAATARESKPKNSRLFRRRSLANLEDDADYRNRIDREDRDGAPLLNEDLETASSGTWLCSCCSEPFNISRSAQSQANRNGIEDGIPHLGLQMLRREKRPLAPSMQPADHPVSCSKLKFAANYESDVSFPNYDEDEEAYDDRRLGAATIIKEDVVSEKLIHRTPAATTTKQMDKAALWSRSSTTETTSPASPTRGADSNFAENSITSKAMNDPVPAACTRRLLPSKGEIMMSPRFSEMVVCEDSPRAQEEMKLRLSSALESSWSGLPSPVVDLDAPSVMALQNLAKRLTKERNNSTLDDPDADLDSDVEGECSADPLKHEEEELDGKSINDLYRELEEERNASTTAANESMAMINRLQEEKAAMQMEALQYLRMMENQAEYDQEANERLNDLLNDREKELKDLAEELDSCKRRLRQAAEENMREPMLPPQRREALAKAPRCTRTVLSDYALGVTPRSRGRGLCRSKSEECNYDSRVVEDSVFSFREEKAQLAACLKRLNKMLLLQPSRVGQAEKNASENGRLSNVSLKNTSKSRSDTHKGNRHPMENGSTEMSVLQDDVLKLIDRVEALDADKRPLGMLSVH